MRNMRTFRIQLADDTIATIRCREMRFDLEHPEEHEIISPDGKSVAVRILLGPDMRLEEVPDGAR